MRITVSHNRSKEEVVQSVDKSFNELFQGIGGICQWRSRESSFNKEPVLAQVAPGIERDKHILVMGLDPAEASLFE